MKYLIVNADDFGLARSVNEGIVKAMRSGVLSAVSLMPSGEAFSDAVAWARELGIKEAGAHLSLTESIPTLKAHEIPTLIAKNGRFHAHHSDFFLRYFLGNIRKGEILDELRNQLDMVKNCGVKINYLSSHEHIHMMRPILEIFIGLAKEYGIQSIRCVKKEHYPHRWGARSIYRSVIISSICRGAEETLKSEGMTCPDNFLGFIDSGNINEDNLIIMIKSLKDGVTELVAHPGFLGSEVLERYNFHINCERELYALTSPRVKKAINDNRVTLVNHSGLNF